MQVIELAEPLAWSLEESADFEKHVRRLVEMLSVEARGEANGPEVRCKAQQQIFRLMRRRLAAKEGAGLSVANQCHRKWAAVAASVLVAQPELHGGHSHLPALRADAVALVDEAIVRGARLARAACLMLGRSRQFDRSAGAPHQGPLCSWAQTLMEPLLVAPWQLQQQLPGRTVGRLFTFCASVSLQSDQPSSEPPVEGDETLLAIVPALRSAAKMFLKGWVQAVSGAPHEFTDADSTAAALQSPRWSSRADCVQAVFAMVTSDDEELAELAKRLVSLSAAGGMVRRGSSAPAATHLTPSLSVAAALRSLATAAHTPASSCGAIGSPHRAKGLLRASLGTVFIGGVASALSTLLEELPLLGISRVRVSHRGRARLHRCLSHTLLFLGDPCFLASIICNPQWGGECLMLCAAVTRTVLASDMFKADASTIQARTAVLYRFLDFFAELWPHAASTLAADVMSDGSNKDCRWLADLLALGQPLLATTSALHRWELVISKVLGELPRLVNSGAALSDIPAALALTLAPQAAKLLQLGKVRWGQHTGPDARSQTRTVAKQLQLLARAADRAKSATQPVPRVSKNALKAQQPRKPAQPGQRIPTIDLTKQQLRTERDMPVKYVKLQPSRRAGLQGTSTSSTASLTTTRQQQLRPPLSRQARPKYQHTVYSDSDSHGDSSEDEAIEHSKAASRKRSGRNLLQAMADEADEMESDPVMKKYRAMVRQSQQQAAAAARLANPSGVMPMANKARWQTRPTIDGSKKTTTSRPEADIKNLYKHILSWNFEKLESSNLPPAQAVPDVFADIDEYISCFEPLLLRECFAHMQKAKEDLGGNRAPGISESLRVRKIGIQRVDRFTKIKLEQLDEKQPMPRQNALLVLFVDPEDTNGKRADERVESLRILAMVEDQTDGPATRYSSGGNKQSRRNEFVARALFPDTSTDRGRLVSRTIARSMFWRVYKVLNLVTFTRE